MMVQLVLAVAWGAVLGWDIGMLPLLLVGGGGGVGGGAQPEWRDACCHCCHYCHGVPHHLLLMPAGVKAESIHCVCCPLLLLLLLLLAGWSCAGWWPCAWLCSAGGG